MSSRLTRVLSAVLLVAPAVAASGQSLPTAQPAFLRLIREDVKVGRAAEHETIEAGWPAAYERAKSPDYYLALDSLSGATEAWFLIPTASYTAMGEAIARDLEPALAPELARLQRADADVITNVRSIELRARPEFSFGTYPDLAKQRYWEITVFRMRPGSEDAFAAIAKSYGAASTRAGNTMGYRVYEVTAGMPGPTYFIFSSVSAFGEFDKMLAVGEATMKAMTADDQPIAKKFNEGLINAETFRMRLNPRMSYVPKDVRASDPAFWTPKKPAAAKPAATAPPTPPKPTQD